MTKFERARTFIEGLIIVLCCIILIVLKRKGYAVLLFILGMSFMIRGVRYLVYFFAMARHMVGGKMILFIGIIYLDFGMFTLTLRDEPLVFVGLYLLGLYAFSGLVDILKAMEAYRINGYWKHTLITGIVQVAIAGMALFCGIVLKSPLLLVRLYCMGLLYSGISLIIQSLRTTTIAYIQ